MLLTLSIIAFFVVFINVPYMFCFVGVAIIIPYTLSKVLAFGKDEEEQASRVNSAVVKQIRQNKFQQKSQVFMASISIIVNLVFIWSVYKNYHNLILQSAMKNFLITASLDNFIVRPFLFAAYSLIINSSPSFNSFIDIQCQIAESINQESIKKVHDNHISAISPKKLSNSPSKVPKALEIQPKGGKENYISTLDLAKSLKKPSLSPISLKKRTDMKGEAECSLISILNSN